MTIRILRLPEVQEKVGLSRSSIYLRIQGGNFPSPVSLGGRAVGWLSAEVEAWIEAQVEHSRSSEGDGEK